MSKRTWFVSVLTLLALTVPLAACGGDDEEAVEAGAVTVELGEQNASGQSGTAILTSTAEGQTTVTLELSKPPDNPQPVHIHAGTCEELGDVAYPLTNLEGGSSETTLDVSLDELQSGQFAINAHESEENIQNYVACGPIGEGGSSGSAGAGY